MADKECPKCMSPMIEGDLTYDRFCAVREDGLRACTDTKKYMCIECGYIEQYAVDLKFYEKRENESR